MKFRWIALVAILTVTTGVALAQNFEREIKKAFFAHHGEVGDVVYHAGGVEGVETVIQALRLSDAQSSSLRALMDSRRKETGALMKEIEEKRRSLEQALEEPSPNALQIGTLTVSIQELERRSTAIEERFQSAFSNMLNPEQRAAFDGIKAAAKQIQAFHAAGLIDPVMIHHEIMFGSEAGIFMNKLIETEKLK